MREPALALLAGVALALCGGPSWAQGFEGLDLSGEAGAPATPVGTESSGFGIDLSKELPAADDWRKGPPVVAVPVPGAEGQLDLPAFKVFHAALAERLGARLVPADATLAAVSQELDYSRAALVRIALAVQARQVIAVTTGAKKLDVRVYPREANLGVVALSFKRRGTLQREKARGYVTNLLQKSRGILFVQEQSAPAVLEMSALDLTQFEEPPPVEQEAVGEIEVESAPKPVVMVPQRPPALRLTVGGGVSMRDLRAVGGALILPRSSGTVSGLTASLAFQPLRWVSSQESGKLAPLTLEARYRRNLVAAVVQGGEGSGSTACEVTDDELAAGAAYRYPTPGRWPKPGAKVAWNAQRTLFGCPAPALETAYRSTEAQLLLEQPLLSEKLSLELSAGPRFVFSRHALGFPNRALSGELGLSWWPTQRMLLKAGGRVSVTQLTTWPEGITLDDRRTFLGLEVGALF